MPQPLLGFPLGVGILCNSTLCREFRALILRNRLGNLGLAGGGGRSKISNLGHLAPAPLARRLVDALETNITRFLGNLGRNLAVFARRLVYLLETKIARLLGNLGRDPGLKGKLVGETKLARLCGNLAQIQEIVLNSRRTAAVAPNSPNRLIVQKAAKRSKALFLSCS